MKEPKVVLHCQVSTGKSDPCYGENGMIRHDLEEMFGEPINFRGFGGYLDGSTREEFMTECKDAEVVVVDAWTHPPGPTSSWGVKDPHETMLEIVREVRRINPRAILFADLMEGKYEVAVHSIAKPIRSWTDDPIVSALEIVRARKTAKETDKRLILVVDDNHNNLTAAREQFAEQNLLITTNSYLSALKLISEFRFDVVMTDLMMPAERENQSPESIKKHVGQEMPMGCFVAAKALAIRAPSICVVSDTGHHAHPAGHVAEMLAAGPISWFCGVRCKFTKTKKGHPAKDWANILTS